MRKGQKISYQYKDKYGRKHSLKDNVSYFLDPDDGVPKQVITQRSTIPRTLVGALNLGDEPTREVMRKAGGFMFRDSWIALAAEAISEKASSDKDPKQPEDMQQLVHEAETSSTANFNVIWDRTDMKNQSSLAMQLVYWIYAGVPPDLIAPQAPDDEEDSSHVVVTANTLSENKITTWKALWDNQRKVCWWLAFRYFLGTVVLTAMVRSPPSTIPQKICISA